MGQIFVSYSRRDTEIVNKAVDWLEKDALEVWIDREDILAGNSWRKQIVEAIDQCDAFVLMLSSNSVMSENVQKEVILAADSGRKILVVMLEPVKIPVEIRYQLAGLQFIDVATLGFEKSLEQLIAALEEHLKKIRPNGEKSHSQMELVIQGVNLADFTAEKQEQLLAFIANLSNTDRGQLNIANMAAGSVHVFMDMPAQTAYLLMAMALNHETQFATMGIVSLRMDGHQYFIHIVQGMVLPQSTSSDNRVWWIILAVIALLLLLFYCLFSARPTAPITGDVPTATFTAEAGAPTATFTPTETDKPTDFTPTATATATSTPEEVEYQILSGVINSDHTACNYGPGNLFLNNESLKSGIQLQVFGRDIDSSWVYVLADGYSEKCWVDLSKMSLNGDVASLEMLYPGNFALPPSDFWPAPQNVKSARSKSEPDKLTITWDPLILADGDLERPGAPRYFLELWLCQNGELVFTNEFTWDNFLIVTDEAGCSEPSHGLVYIAEKHGYPGPTTIPWEQHP